MRVQASTRVAGLPTGARPQFEETPAPSIQSLEELVNRMFNNIQEIRSDVKDLKVQEAALEKQVRRTVSDLIDDEVLE